MGYGTCSCDCICTRYAEDGWLCDACQYGNHARGFDETERELQYDRYDYDPPDPMEREP